MREAEDVGRVSDQLEIVFLRYAISADEHQSFRRAADVLGIKPSSLSRGIRRMEKQLGVTIFERLDCVEPDRHAGGRIPDQLRRYRNPIEDADRDDRKMRDEHIAEAGHGAALLRFSQAS
ncbi:MAG: LysR family transcriptional regulator [Bradyrhizobium sp.]|nr:LysR family transcriptional regulator [Bradyrhizobium sp.]